MNWDLEKSIVKLQKLKSAYFDQVLVENIEIQALQSGHCVSTFRTPILPDWIQKDIQRVKQNKKKRCFLPYFFHNIFCIVIFFYVTATKKTMCVFV